MIKRVITFINKNIEEEGKFINNNEIMVYEGKIFLFEIEKTLRNQYNLHVRNVEKMKNLQMVMSI